MGLTASQVNGNFADKALEYLRKTTIGVRDQMLYHDLEHLVNQDEAILQVGTSADVDDYNISLARIAAMFHDSRFWLLDRGVDHKYDLLEDFAENEGMPAKLKGQVMSLLDFIDHAGKPRQTVEEVIMDGMNSQWANKDTMYRMSLLKKETEILTNQRFSEIEWYKLQESKMAKVQFYSDFAISTFQPGVDANQGRLKRLTKKLIRKMDTLLEQELRIDGQQLKDLKKKLRKAEGRPERGIETLFRLISRNHFTMNAMVDKKSSILISINSIILSIIIGTVLRELERDPHLVVPVIMVVITNLWSIALAVFATRPESSHGDEKKPNIQQTGGNLLFYGNFHHLSEKEYLDGMVRLMANGEKLYASIASDVYYLGLSLKRKFGLLRRSFNIFVYGFIISVVTFLICHLFFDNEAIVTVF